MSEMVERARKAIIAEIRAQFDGGSTVGAAYIEPYDDGSGETVIDGHVDLDAVARACLVAVREPTEGMKKAAWDVWTKHDKRRMSLAGGSGSLSHPDWETHYWQAMVDAALREPR